MVKVTEEQVQQAEARAEAAEKQQQVAASELEASPYSEMAAMKHSEASREAAQLRASAREMRAAFKVQVEEELRRASRPELERAAAAEIKAAGVELGEREGAVVEALGRAQEALVGVMVAADAYNAAVQAHADVLAAAGLDVRGGESGGARSVLNSCRVKVRGREYTELPPSGLTGWLVHRVVEARRSRFDDVVVLLQWAARAAEHEASAVVGKVPAPEQAVKSRVPLLSEALRAARGR
ncbi:hypothetical protein ACFUG9_34020 [Streptomyces griseoincarnatus]